MLSTTHGMWLNGSPAEKSLCATVGRHSMLLARDHARSEWISARRVVTFWGVLPGVVNLEARVA